MILSDKYELMRKNFRNFAETEFTTEIQEKLDKEGGFDTEMYKKSSCKSDLNKIAKIILTNLTEVYKRFDKDIPKPYWR